MINVKSNKVLSKSKKNESVEDPHELLLSLVDLGSLDAEEALLACVSEMSDAECKRVLGSLSLPECCDEVEDEMSVEVDEPTVEFPSDEDELEETDDAEEVDLADEDETAEEDEDDIELEARIRRLERCLRTESMNRNRVRRFPRRTNR
jgi:hypothetical protein